MVVMGTNDEIVSPVTGATPIPVGAEGTARTTPTADTILKLIAASGSQPWFPSRHAAEGGTARDALDGPLEQLRLANLISAATWVRGMGQGYVLTPEGDALVLRGGEVTTAAPAEAPTVQKPDPEPPAKDSTSLTPEQQAARHFGLNLRTPLFVPIILVANVCWFAVGAAAAVQGDQSLSRYLGEGQPPSVLHRIGAITGGDLLNGEWWRLLSTCFVHIGLLHLLANMFALAMMGPLAEMLWGRWRLTVIYFLSGLGGSCLAMSNNPEAILAGASGAIWGVLASLLAWLMLFRSDLPTEVAGEWARRLWLAFLINAGVSFLPGVSWEAHLGGGVAGFVASGLLNALRSAPRPRQLLALVLLMLLPVLSVGGLVMSMNRSQAWLPLREKQAARAERDRIAGFVVAEEAYNRDVVPRLNRLSPDAARSVQLRMWSMLLKPKVDRNPEAVADVRAKLEEMKTTGREAIGYLSVPPVGFEPLDRIRSGAKEFADARVAECTLLLEMLDSPTVPTEDAWTALGAARRTTDAAWEQIRQR